MSDISGKAFDLINELKARCIDACYDTYELYERDKAENALRNYIAEQEAEVTKGHELQDSDCDRIVELNAFIGQLIAVGDRAIAFNEIDRFIDKWNALVKDWKEREE